MISEDSLFVTSIKLLDSKTGINSINDLGEGAVTNDAKGNGRGSGGKSVIFQMAPIPLLGVLIYSNRSQYVILKVSLKNLSRTYLLGASNIEMFRANKMPRFTCNFSHFCKRQSTYIWGISSMKKCFNP
jgi:hypothetical protein